MTDRLIEIEEDDDYPLDDFLKEETVKTDKIEQMVEQDITRENRQSLGSGECDGRFIIKEYVRNDDLDMGADEKIDEISYDDDPSVDEEVIEDLASTSKG